MTESVSGPQPVRPNKQAQKPVAPKDIEQYVRVQEEIKQIEALLKIAQNMVHQQLQDARAKGKNLAFSFNTVPMSGTAEQRGNIGTYNTLQPQVATEIQSLVKQISILKGGNLAVGDTLDSYLDQLEGIAKSFPQLSQTQINSLNSIVSKLNGLANHVGKNTQAAFWNEVSNMYQKMYVTNEQALNEVQSQIKKLQKAKAPAEEIEGAKNTAGNLDTTQNRFGSAAAGAAAKGAESGSLPSHFQHTILNHYMPGQEKYLRMLAEILMFDNMGAQIGNSLLSIMAGFSSAATTFNFSNFLHSNGKGAYNGTATQANAQISKETAAAYNDLKAIKQALAKIQSQIKSIENNTSLSQSQKKQLINKLQEVSKGLQASKAQVTALYNTISEMKAVADGSKYFKIIGPPRWVTQLPAYENIAINGASEAQAKKWGVPAGGGLVQVAAKVNTFQQTYSDQGQNQQMMLQMRMTEIQQEWTVVSTALQLLNQMYMGVAQGIYK